MIIDVYKAADRHVSAFRSALLKAGGMGVRRGQDMDSSAAERFLSEALLGVYRAAFDDAGKIVDSLTVRKASFGGQRKLTATRPETLAWIKRRSGVLIQDWGSTSRQAFRTMLAQAYERGMSTSHLSRWLRNVGIGLDERYAKAVESYRARLMRDGMDAKRADALTRRYYNKLLKVRADRIARTETSMAANRGLIERLLQMIEEGTLSRDAELEWVTKEDERTCEICNGLDGERRKVLGEMFDGGYEAPPSHPSCRCVLKLVAPGY